MAKEALHPPPPPEAPTVEPLPESATASILDSDPAALEAWYKKGLEGIGAGEVAVVLMGKELALYHLPLFSSASTMRQGGKLHRS